MAALTVLAAAGASAQTTPFDEGFRASFRTKFTETCVAKAQGQSPAWVTIDYPAICNCAADDLLAHHTPQQLAQHSVEPAEMRTVMAQCLHAYPPKVKPAA